MLEFYLFDCLAAPYSGQSTWVYNALLSLLLHFVLIIWVAVPYM